MATLGLSRRVGAIMALKLASLVLRGGTALYQRRAISRALLCAMLSVSQALERAGLRLVLGQRRASLQPPSNKEEANDRLNR